MKSLVFLLITLLITLFSGCHHTKEDSWITGEDDKDTVDISMKQEHSTVKTIDFKKRETHTQKKKNKSYHPILTQVKTNRILLVLPFTGEQTKIGLHLKKTIEKINDELESPFKLLYFDTKSNLYQQKGELYDFLIKEDVDYIIGGLQYEDTKDLAEVASIKNIRVFSLSPNDKLALIHKNLFIQSLTPENITYSIVKYAIEEKGFRKFSILYPYTELGIEYSNYFKEYVTAMGGEVSLSVVFNPKNKNLDKPVSKLVGRDQPYKRADFHRLIRKAKNIKSPYWKKRYINRAKMKLKPIFDYDAIFLPISSKLMNYVIPTLAAWDLPLQTNNPVLMEQVYHKYLDKNQKYVQVFGLPFWYNPEVFKADSPYINGAIFSAPYNLDVNNSAIPFVSLFQKELATGRPLIYEALLYDLMQILYYVFEKKEPIESYEGIMGRYSFYKNQLFKEFNMAIIHNNRFLSY